MWKLNQFKWWIIWKQKLFKKRLFFQMIKYDRQAGHTCVFKIFCLILFCFFRVKILTQQNAAFKSESVFKNFTFKRKWHTQLPPSCVTSFMNGPLMQSKKWKSRAEWMEFSFNPENEIIFSFPRITLNAFSGDFLSLMTPPPQWGQIEFFMQGP